MRRIGKECIWAGDQWTDRTACPRLTQGPVLTVPASWALAGVLLSVIGSTAPVAAQEPQTSLAIYQHLVETAPGEYDLRGLSISSATGTYASAGVAMLSESNGAGRIGATVAVTSSEPVDAEGMLMLDGPEGWTSEVQVGDQVSLPSLPTEP